MKLFTVVRMAMAIALPLIHITNAALVTSSAYHAKRDAEHGTWDLGGGASSVYLCSPAPQDPNLCTVSVLTGDAFATGNSYIATVLLYNNVCEEQYVDIGISETQLQSGYTITSEYLPQPIELKFPESLTMDLIRHPKVDIDMTEMLPTGIQLKYGDYQGDPFKNSNYQAPQKSLWAYPAGNIHQTWYVFSLPFEC